MKPPKRIQIKVEFSLQSHQSAFFQIVWGVLSLCSTQCQNAMRESENIVLKRISSCSFALALFLAQWRFFRIRIIHQRFKSFYLKQMLLFACLVKKYNFERTSQFDKCQEYLWKLSFFFESCSLFENCNSASWV